MMNLSKDLQISVSVALSEAASRGHEMVGLEHLLFALLHDDGTTRVVRACGGNVPRMKARVDEFLNTAFEALPPDERGDPTPTIGLQRALSRAATHVESSGKEEVEGFNVLIAMFGEPESWAVHFLQEEGITRLDLVSFVSHGIRKAADVDVEEEDADGGAASEAATPGGPRGAEDEDEDEDGESDERPLKRSKKDPLEAWAVNLNALAKAGRIDPLIGRQREIERAIHILARRRKNNPLFVGDAGVGKTAIAEGLALAIHEGKVPDLLKDSTIFSLDMGALLAGTRYRGDFENRMKAVIKAITKQPGAILFIDELHTVIGAGSVEGGSMDASNLLKPALARGELRCIGSSTHEDYRKYLERDHALMRRFQKIDVDEPSVADTVKILEGLRPSYEEHHGVQYTHTAIETAAELSARYLQDRRLPDKAIDLMDEAGAMVKLTAKRGTRVTPRDIEATLSKMAQIPPRRVSRDDRDRLANLEQELKGVVFGQDHAIDQLVAAIKLSRAGLREPQKPVGSFLLTGPTGVGKTELARQLGLVLGLHFHRFDMSEYMERHTVSRLIGAPPGYVGFDQGGLLTDAIRTTPHSVLLLDEVEKAHPDVFNILLQVMDHGTLTDNNGRKADFRHVILLMTSNVGARELERRSVGFGTAAEERMGDEDVEYKRVFSPEFRNRLDARIRFHALSPLVMGRIVDKFVAELRAQLGARKVTVELTDAAREWFGHKGYDPKFGARPLGRVLQTELKAPLSEELLFGRLANGGAVTVDIVDDRPVLRFGGEGV
jgi:ATP-dependent Clp protease ATP-binding subunit ClpA